MASTTLSYSKTEGLRPVSTKKSKSELDGVLSTSGLAPSDGIATETEPSADDASPQVVEIATKNNLPPSPTGLGAKARFMRRRIRAPKAALAEVSPQEPDLPDDTDNNSDDSQSIATAEGGITVHSDMLISNMEEMKNIKRNEDEGKADSNGAPSASGKPTNSSPQSRKSKGSRSTRRKRGNSLEREVGITILQTAADGSGTAHFLVQKEEKPDESFSSAKDILNDLMTLSTNADGSTEIQPVNALYSPPIEDESFSKDEEENPSSDTLRHTQNDPLLEEKPLSSQAMRNTSLIDQDDDEAADVAFQEAVTESKESQDTNETQGSESDSLDDKEDQKIHNQVLDFVARTIFQDDSLDATSSDESKRLVAMASTEESQDEEKKDSVDDSEDIFHGVEGQEASSMESFATSKDITSSSASVLGFKKSTDSEGFGQTFPSPIEKPVPFPSTTLKPRVNGSVEMEFGNSTNRKSHKVSAKHEVLQGGQKQPAIFDTIEFNDDDNDDEWTTFEPSPFGPSCQFPGQTQHDVGKKEDPTSHLGVPTKGTVESSCDGSGSTAPMPDDDESSPDSPTSVTDFSTKQAEESDAWSHYSSTMAEF